MKAYHTIEDNEKFNGLIVEYDIPSICPNCQTALSPVNLNNYFFNGSGEPFNLVHSYLCTKCEKPFITLSTLSKHDNSLSDFYTRSMSIWPKNKAKPKDFDLRILKLSPQFVKIYNQALQAEKYQLNEIAGIGYRKAVEFLIKDFLIKTHPDEEEKIKKDNLMKCIKKYINNPILKNLSSRAVWLGNDATHYIKKHTDKDTNDLKEFIEAMINYLNMVILAEEAEKIEAK